MLSLAQLRKINPKLEKISDAELEKIRSVFYDTANLAFDMFMQKKSGSKKPLGSLQKIPITDIITPWRPNEKKQE